MKKVIKAAIVMTICLCLTSTSLVTHAYSSQNISEQNDVCFETGKIVDDSKISNIDQLNTKFSEFKDKPNAEEIREVIARINPNSIVLDMNEMKNIKVPEDLIKAFETRNVKIPENVDKGSFLQVVQEVRSLSKTGDNDVYFILEYDHETGQLLRNPTKWCDECLALVIVDMIEYGMGASYLGWWGTSRWSDFCTARK